MKYKTRFFAFFLAMTMYHLVSNFAHPVTPTIIKNLALHDYMFGVALAMMKTGDFLMSPFWGKINGYISSRVTLLLCCCGYGLAQLFFALSTTEISIIFARFAAGIFVGGIMVSFLTYVVNTAKPEDQGRYLTYSATIASVCGPFGYLIGGLIGEFSVRAAFIAQTLGLLATGLLFYAVSQPDAQQENRPSLKTLAAASNPLEAFLDCRKFMTAAFVMLFAINILIAFGNTGFDQAFNYYLKDQLSLTSSYNGIIKAGVGFVSFLANMTLCIWIIQKTNIRRSLALLTAACALAVTGALLASGIGFFIGWSILVFAGYSVSMPVLQNMVAVQSRPDQRNLVMGFYNATKSLGGIAGSLTAGFIYSLHAKLPFACTALMYGIAFLVSLAYFLRSRQEYS